MPGLPTDFPPLETFEGRRDNLPIQLTSFVGRHRELSELKQTLQASGWSLSPGSGEQASHVLQLPRHPNFVTPSTMVLPGPASTVE